MSAASATILALHPRHSQTAAPAEGSEATSPGTLLAEPREISRSAAILALHPRYSQTTAPAAGSEATSPRILLAEPHEISRLGIHRLLEGAVPEARVSSVASWWALSQLLERTSPTVLLVSSDLAGEPSSELAAALRQSGTMVVLMVRTLERGRLRTFLRFPIAAVLREQDLSPSTLASVLGGLERGVVAMPWETTRELLALAAAADDAVGPCGAPNLTARELDTLREIARGLTNRQIARLMSITEHGVKRHVANILAKLHCNNRAMAVSTAIRLNLLGQK
jgi:two-component system, NarL family, nitrate/nitrite response regulator NarL